MIKKSYIPILLLLLLGFSYSEAQQTRSLPDFAAQFRQAETLYELEKYAAARPLFEAIADPASGADPLIRIQALYYTALCAVKLDHKDAEFLLEDFLAKHGESSLRNQAMFRLGLLQFQKKSYRNALRSFSGVDERALNNKELAELYFKRGFCYLRQDDLVQARQNFNQLRGTQTDYTVPATYYFAHLSYKDGDYSKALQDFEMLKSEKAYSAVIPLYIVHIHYKLGEYDKVIEKGVPLYSSERNKQNLEVGRMIGDSYYRLGNYKEALNLLEFYFNNSRRRPNREESYQLGYLYYKNEKFQEAIRYLQPAVGANDSISQFAFYHLAGAYLKTDQKNYASNAFNSAYRLPFNQAIREESLFNYARLSLEISINPYNESLKALNQYLEDFPNGRRRNEALTYLVHLYLSTNNYREALASIENIKDRDQRLNEAYQKITYNRGIELFNDRDYFNAVAMFRKSQDHPIDKDIQANSVFWTGESYYRLSQPELATTYYNRFLALPNARKLPLFYVAHYNMGYVWFQQKKYAQAVQSFNSFLSNQERENKKMVSDAILRIGDSHFISKRYQEAIQQYEKAAGINPGEADYATFQKARALGALGSQEIKIATLRPFLREFSSSPYAPEAFYEMGNTSLILNKNAEALQYFNSLIQNYPSSNFGRIALMKIGLVHYNNNDTDRAIETFKKIAQDYPGSTEAYEALNLMRNIYVDLNRVDEFIAYSNNLSFARVSDREQDSLIYVAAFNKYMDGNCPSAKTGFVSYLNRFPQGFYSLNANFYKAECEFRANNTGEALKNYEAVIERPRSEFTERSLQRAARINQNMNNHARAREQFTQLEQVAANPANRIEAITGQLFTSYQLDDHQAVLLAANKLLKDSRVPETSLAEIHLTAGKSAMILQQDAKALESFRQAIRLSPRGNFGAEANYHLASVLFRQQKTTEAENAIFDLAANFASYDYWVASGFILLSDIYVQTGNIFQARQTLQSVIENHQGDTLREHARKKLNELPK